MKIDLLKKELQKILGNRFSFSESVRKNYARGEDIFEPTLVALENLFELIPKGGIVAFDQFSYENFPGETLAFKEKLGLDFSLKKFSYHPFISYFVK